MAAVLRIFERLREVEWARSVGSGVEPIAPPLLSWRFKVPDTRIEELIVRAVGAYVGRVQWVVWKGNRNWVIEPEPLAGFAKDFRVDVEALRAFADRFPSQTLEAVRDAASLAAFLEKELTPPRN
jgi:hypothetical protein